MQKLILEALEKHKVTQLIHVLEKMYVGKVVYTTYDISDIKIIDIVVDRYIIAFILNLRETFSLENNVEPNTVQSNIKNIINKNVDVVFLRPWEVSQYSKVRKVKNKLIKKFVGVRFYNEYDEDIIVSEVIDIGFDINNSTCTVYTKVIDGEIEMPEMNFTELREGFINTFRELGVPNLPSRNGTGYNITYKEL